MGTYGEPIGLRLHPEPDGTHILKVKTPSGEEIEVAFSPASAIQILQVLQRGIVAQWERKGPTPSFPVLDVDDVDLVHGQGTTELLVQTRQIGYAILVASNSTLGKIKLEADRALALRGARKTLM